MTSFSLELLLAAILDGGRGTEQPVPVIPLSTVHLGDIINFKHGKSRVCKGSVFDFFKVLSLTDAKYVLQISLKIEPRLKINIF